MRQYGILGQSAPAAATFETAYTVPAGKHATAKVLVCNSSYPTSFRIALAPNGAAIATEQYIAYDQQIESNDSVSSVAFTVGETDEVRTFSTSGAVSFTVTGIEDDD